LDLNCSLKGGKQMKLQRSIRVTFVLILPLLILMSGCASTPKPVTKPASVAAAPDQSEPTTPIGAFVIEAPKPPPAAPKEPPKPGSLESVVQKMESSPYTLYWKENNSYSYYVGGLLDAEYTPGKGLTVQEVKGDDTGVICSFNAEGKLSSPDTAKDAKSKDVCSKLMFTLDDELSD